jgi:hypothetical protein
MVYGVDATGVLAGQALGTNPALQASFRLATGLLFVKS